LAKPRSKGKRRTKRKKLDDPFPREWPRWVRKCIREFDAAEKPLVKEFERTIDLEHAPDWVMNMFIELYRLSAPSIPLPVPGKEISGPHFLGSVCGHLEAAVESKYGLKLIFDKIEEARKQLDGKLLATLTKQQFAYWQRERSKNEAAIQECQEQVEEIWGQVETAIAGKMAVVDRCKEAASHEEFEPRVDFADAYTRAAKTKIFAEDGHFFHAKSTNEKIETSTIGWLMVYQWRNVENFGSFGEFRHWLGTKFGSQNIGGTDRLKQFCKRHGYNPGGKPGRPRARQRATGTEIPEFTRLFVLTSDVFKSRKRPKK
jgi:hypothetical protein